MRMFEELRRHCTISIFSIDHFVFNCDKCHSKLVAVNLPLQICAIEYSFKGFLKELDIQGLYVFKNALSKDQFLPKYEINKVNLNHYNLILNYHLTFGSTR